MREVLVSEKKKSGEGALCGLMCVCLSHIGPLFFTTSKEIDTGLITSDRGELAGS